MSAQENKAIVRRYWGVWEEGNTDLVDELLAPDYFNHTPALLISLRAQRGSRKS